jgi:hypothetical protein
VRAALPPSFLRAALSGAQYRDVEEGYSPITGNEGHQAARPFRSGSRRRVFGSSQHDSPAGDVEDDARYPTCIV